MRPDVLELLVVEVEVVGTTRIDVPSTPRPAQTAPCHLPTSSNTHPAPPGRVSPGSGVRGGGLTRGPTDTPTGMGRLTERPGRRTVPTKRPWR